MNDDDDSDVLSFILMVFFIGIGFGFTLAKVQNVFP